jgi:ribonuclease HI
MKLSDSSAETVILKFITQLGALNCTTHTMIKGVGASFTARGTDLIMKGVQVNAITGSVHVFSDGSTLDQADKINRVSGIGVFFAENHPGNISEMMVGVQNSQRAELSAFIKALEVSRRLGFKKITVFSDSTYTLGEAARLRGVAVPSISSFSIKKPNLDLLADLAIQLHYWTAPKLDWQWVKGHKEYGNIRADQLARAASTVARNLKRLREAATDVIDDDSPVEAPLEKKVKK